VHVANQTSALNATLVAWKLVGTAMQHVALNALTFAAVVQATFVQSVVLVGATGVAKSFVVVVLERNVDHVWGSYVATVPSIPAIPATNLFAANVAKLHTAISVEKPIVRHVGKAKSVRSL